MVVKKFNRKKPFVVYWNNIPAPYMVERFNALADRSTFNFEAWFNDRIVSDRSWLVDESGWRFRHRFINSVSCSGKKFHLPLNLIKRNKPDLIVSLYAEPSYFLGWFIAKMREVKTGFWVEKTFDHLETRKLWKDNLKRWLFKKVDFIVTSGRDGQEYVRRYGVSYHKIFFAPHVIDYFYFKNESAFHRSVRSMKDNKNDLREITFLYVGRLLRQKGIEYLLDAFRELQKKINLNVKLLIVGDGKDEKFFKNKCKIEFIKNVIFTGFLQKIELPKIYASADVFVFPSLGDTYGLVIDEAIACQLPVISTETVGEINSRIKNGLNGFLIPAQDSRALEKVMKMLALDKKLRNSLRYYSNKSFSYRTPEKWAADFEEIIFSILNNT